MRHHEVVALKAYHVFYAVCGHLNILSSFGFNGLGNSVLLANKRYELPPGFGLRQPSGALGNTDGGKSGGGPPHSKTLARARCGSLKILSSFGFWN
jgi:hypothetical protein